VPTFVDRGVSRGQCGGSPTVVHLSFLDRWESIVLGMQYATLSTNFRTKSVKIKTKLEQGFHLLPNIHLTEVLNKPRTFMGKVYNLNLSIILEMTEV
jgi:hypothetical protein